MGPAQKLGALAIEPATEPSAAPSEEHCAAFESSRLRLIQKSLSPVGIGVPIAAIIAAALLMVWSDWRPAAAWALVYSLVTIGAIFAISRQRGDLQKADIARRRVLVAGALMSASNAVWAAMALLFWQPHQVANQLFIIVLLATGIPCAMATMAVSIEAFFISIAPLAAALILRPLFEGGVLMNGVAALGAVYCVVMFFIAKQLHDTTTSMLQIKENNNDLLVQLAKAKADSDAARYRAERLNQAKSTFLANMSHELRTPLNAILGFSEVIHNEILGPIGISAYKEYAGDIHASGKHLLGLINDILDLSRIEAGRLDLSPVVLSVAEVVGDIVRLTESAAHRNNVTLKVDIPVDLPHIRVDERALRQVLLNLTTNAVKFTPGGTVTISAQPGAPAFGRSGLTMTIEDNGIGIKKEDLAMVMEAFGQVRVEDMALTATREQGTGLGLPIVRGLIETHGGTFTLESEFGKGTRAIVQWPPRCVLEPAHVEPLAERRALNRS